MSGIGKSRLLNLRSYRTRAGHLSGIGLRHRNEFCPSAAADRAPLGRDAQLDMAADGADVEVRFGEVFTASDGLERQTVNVGVHGLRFQRVSEHHPGAVSFRFR